MIPCKSCGAECNDELETCPSCGMRIRKIGADRQDDSYLNKDKWIADDSDSRSSSPQKTQELLPRDAPIKKAITRKSGAGGAKFNATIMGVRPDNGTKEDQTLPLGSKMKSESGPPATLVLGTPKSSTDSTLVMGTEASSTSREKSPVEVNAISPLVTEDDHIELLVESESEADFPQQAGKHPVATDEHAAPNRIGALLRDEDDSFYPHSRKKPAAHSHRPPHQNHARLGVDNAPSLSICLGISSAILISTWLIPNIFSVKPVFPFTLIGSTHGSGLVALLAEPTCGALLLALILLPMSQRRQAGASLIVGLLSLSIPLLLGSPALPLDGPTVLGASLIDIAVAVLIFVYLRVPSLGHFALLLVPGVLFATAVFGVTSGRLPAAHLVLFKTPLNIYASMLISGFSATALLIMAKRTKARA
ncbi:MAG: hypothetical protein GY762_10215 [Proteobacteria bacterium]|nr:hypothetical protein [Pseudomonadota bacterium]